MSNFSCNSNANSNNYCDCNGDCDFLTWPDNRLSTHEMAVKNCCSQSPDSCCSKVVKSYQIAGNCQLANPELKNLLQAQNLPLNFTNDMYYKVTSSLSEISSNGVCAGSKWIISNSAICSEDSSFTIWPFNVNDTATAAIGFPSSNDFGNTSYSNFIQDANYRDTCIPGNSTGVNSLQDIYSLESLVSCTGPLNMAQPLPY